MPGNWQAEVASADVVVILHAHITGIKRDAFDRDNVEATQRVLEAAQRADRPPFVIHMSSAVVRSSAQDDFTRTKRLQEALVLGAPLPTCVLRPTLMFGWFDPKHLGWLARFMCRVPVFPIPGTGRFARQPLYVRDVCKVVDWCIDRRPSGRVFDLVGSERIDYVDIFRAIRSVQGLRRPFVHIPTPVFGALLDINARFWRPPFTSAQMRALTAGDDFSGVDITSEFGIPPTPFLTAIRETLLDSRFANVVLAETST